MNITYEFNYCQCLS